MSRRHEKESGPDNVRIHVRVKPRSSREAIEGWEDGVLVVRLTSPPVEGAANTALVKLVSKTLKIARSRIRIVSGEKSRNKVLDVSGLAMDDIAERLH
ncbi:MAG: YggU family protein [Deltaproteobacteria bacterium]|nr:YggU family protein [Deltaproteobacteria bacterium]